jgi:hypothetical protein
MGEHRENSGVKRSGREADHSPAASAEVKNGEVKLYLHSSVCLLGIGLIN